MTFTYNFDSAFTNTEQVRLLIGDTTSPGDLADEEIDYLLGVHTSVGGAAMAAGRTLLLRYAKDVDKAVGDLKISASQKYKAFKEAMDELEVLVSSSETTDIYVGGISFDERQTDTTDTDLPPLQTRTGIHDFIQPRGLQSDD